MKEINLTIYVVLCLLFPIQSISATLAGVVRNTIDTSRVDSAMVIIINTTSSTEDTTYTNSQGEFNFSSIASGQYNVDIRKQEFQMFLDQSSTGPSTNEYVIIPSFDGILNIESIAPQGQGLYDNYPYNPTRLLLGCINIGVIFVNEDSQNGYGNNADCNCTPADYWTTSKRNQYISFLNSEFSCLLNSSNADKDCQDNPVVSFNIMDLGLSSIKTNPNEFPCDDNSRTPALFDDYQSTGNPAYFEIIKEADYFTSNSIEFENERDYAYYLSTEMNNGCSSYCGDCYLPGQSIFMIVFCNCDYDGNIKPNLPGLDYPTGIPSLGDDDERSKNDPHYFPPRAGVVFLPNLDCESAVPGYSRVRYAIHEFMHAMGYQDEYCYWTDTAYTKLYCACFCDGKESFGVNLETSPYNEVKNGGCFAGCNDGCVGQQNQTEFCNDCDPLSDEFCFSNDLFPRGQSNLTQFYNNQRKLMAYATYCTLSEGAKKRLGWTYQTDDPENPTAGNDDGDCMVDSLEANLANCSPGDSVWRDLAVTAETWCEVVNEEKTGRVCANYKICNNCDCPITKTMELQWRLCETQGVKTVSFNLNQKNECVTVHSVCVDCSCWPWCLNVVDAMIEPDNMCMKCLSAEADYRTGFEYYQCARNAGFSYPGFDSQVKWLVAGCENDPSADNCYWNWMCCCGDCTCPISEDLKPALQGAYDWFFDNQCTNPYSSPFDRTEQSPCYDTLQKRLNDIIVDTALRAVVIQPLGVDSSHCYLLNGVSVVVRDSISGDTITSWNEDLGGLRHLFLPPGSYKVDVYRGIDLKADTIIHFNMQTPNNQLVFLLPIYINGFNPAPPWITVNQPNEKYTIYEFSNIPYANTLQLSINTYQPIKFKLELYDIQGRLVARNDYGKLVKGDNRLSWDLRQYGINSGGIYFLKVYANGDRYDRKVVLLGE